MRLRVATGAVIWKYEDVVFGKEYDGVVAPVASRTISPDTKREQAASKQGVELVTKKEEALASRALATGGHKNGNS